MGEVWILLVPFVAINMALAITALRETQRIIETQRLINQVLWQFFNIIKKIHGLSETTKEEVS